LRGFSFSSLSVAVAADPVKSAAWEPVIESRNDQDTVHPFFVVATSLADVVIISRCLSSIHLV
jgi:hypothetical protein